MKCSYCGAPLVEGVMCECVATVIAQRDIYHAALHRIVDADRYSPVGFLKAIAAEALAHAEMDRAIREDIQGGSEGDSGDLLGSLRHPITQPHTGEKA